MVFFFSGPFISLFLRVLHETFCHECWYIKSMNKNGYVNDPSYSVYNFDTANNSIKLAQRYGSRHHKVYFDYIKNFNTSSFIDNRFENIQIKQMKNNEQNSSSNKDFYIIVAYDEQPYIFIEHLSTDDETVCSLESMICYEIDSVERQPREFFDILNKNETKHDSIEMNRFGRFKKRCCYGISISILNIINARIAELGQKELKFYLYVLKHPQTSSTSGKLLNLADEVVYDLHTCQADFSIAPLSVTKRREQYIDFTTEFYHDSFAVIGKRLFGNTSLIAFLAPFEWSMWLGVFLTLNIAALVETLYEWLSPYGLTPRGRDRREVWSLSSALTLCWSVIFSHTFKTKSPKCWATRYLGNIWGSFAVIFIASYTANLAAVMVGSKRIHQISGINDPSLASNSYKIGLIANSTLEQFFQTSPQYRHLRMSFIKYRYDSAASAIKALTENKIDFLITEHSIATYYVLKSVNRTLEMIGEPFGKLAFAFAFRKESSIYNLISSNILVLQNDDTIEKSLKDWFLDWKCDKGPIYQVLIFFFISFL